MIVEFVVCFCSGDFGFGFVWLFGWAVVACFGLVVYGWLSGVCGSVGGFGGWLFRVWWVCNGSGLVCILGCLLGMGLCGFQDFCLVGFCCCIAWFW